MWGNALLFSGTSFYGTGRTLLWLYGFPLKIRKSAVDGARKYHAHESLSVQIPFMQTKHEAWSIFQCLCPSEPLLTCTDSSAAWNHDKGTGLRSQMGKTSHATSPPVALTHFSCSCWSCWADAAVPGVSRRRAALAHHPHCSEARSTRRCVSLQVQFSFLQVKALTATCPLLAMIASPALAFVGNKVILNTKLSLYHEIYKK